MGILIANILITWRLTNLCVNEEGPYAIFDHYRDFIGTGLDEFSKCVGKNQFAKAFCCFWCASIWVGFTVAILTKRNLLEGLAYSAGAILLNVFKDK